MTAESQEEGGFNKARMMLRADANVPEILDTGVYCTRQDKCYSDSESYVYLNEVTRPPSQTLTP